MLPSWLPHLPILQRRRLPQAAKAKFWPKRQRKSKEAYIQELEQSRIRTVALVEKITNPEDRLIAQTALGCFDNWLATLKAYESPRVRYWLSAQKAQEEIYFIKSVSKDRQRSFKESISQKNVERLKQRFTEIKDQLSGSTYAPDNHKALNTMVKCIEAYLDLLDKLKDKQANFRRLEKKLLRQLHTLELFALQTHPKSTSRHPA